MNSLNKTAKKVKIIISDVDGVLTDGSIYIGENSTEFKKFNVMDGAGVAFAREAEIKIALLSGRFSHATQSRAEELGLGEDCYQGGLNKLETYEEILKKWDYTDEHVAYIGDDLIDLVVMERVGLPIAVANALHSLQRLPKFRPRHVVVKAPSGKQLRKFYYSGVNIIRCLIVFTIELLMATAK